MEDETSPTGAPSTVRRSAMKLAYLACDATNASSSESGSASSSFCATRISFAPSRLPLPLPLPLGAAASGAAALSLRRNAGSLGVCRRGCLPIVGGGRVGCDERGSVGAAARARRGGGEARGVRILPDPNSTFPCVLGRAENFRPDTPNYVMIL